MSTWARPFSLPGSLTAAVLAGSAAYFAFPGYSIWPLAVLGVGLLAYGLRGHSLRAGAGVGFVFGLALLVPLLRWTGLQVGWFPWLALSVFEALFYAVAGLALTATSRLPHGWQRVLGGAGAWVAMEAVQGRFPWGGFGWSRIGFSQSGSPLLGLSAVAGVPLLTFAVVLAGLCLVEVVRAQAGVRARVLAGAAAVLICAAGLLVPVPVRPEQGEVQVAGVQGNVPRLGLEFNAQRRAVLDNHVRGTMDLAGRINAGDTPRPDLVIWPENASDIDPLRNPDARLLIDEAVDTVAAPVLLGAVLRRGDEVFNTALVWEPGRGAVQQYDKRAPVPFAEYVPHREFFRAITPLVDQAGRFSAGDEVGLMTVRARDGRPVRLGVLICFEVIQDGLVADVLAEGAQLLVVPTNNATFGLSDESRQQLAVSRIRAVQTGRAVAHVSTVGVSALIAPDGTIVDVSQLFTEDVLIAQLPLRSTPTLATRLGVWPETGLALVGLVAVAVGLRRRYRPGRSAQDQDENTSVPTRRTSR